MEFLALCGTYCDTEFLLKYNGTSKEDIIILWRHKHLHAVCIITHYHLHVLFIIDNYKGANRYIL